VRATLTIAHLTWLEARRRRIVLAALIGGIAYLAVYATAMYFIDRAIEAEGVMGVLQRQGQSLFFLQAGLYVANFLALALAVLLPVDSISGEIASGVMQTLASKPIRRSDILLGKWLTYWLMTAAYLVLLAGGIVLVMRLLTRVGDVEIFAALPFMLLGATTLLTISLAGGVRFTTITNGIVAFGFYGLAFIGGWVEQIGAITQNDVARRIGTAISLVSPSDAMWRRAAFELQPPQLRDVPFMSPFSALSLPSGAMVVWTLAYVVAFLALAIWLFHRRPL